MALGYESQIINSQLVNVAPGQAFAPLTFGQSYTGPDFWPRNGVFNVPPVAPSPGTWAGSQANIGEGTTGVGVNPGTSAGAVDHETGKVNWFHPTKSPLVFGILFLVAGILMLQFIHFK